MTQSTQPLLSTGRLDQVCARAQVDQQSLVERQIPPHLPSISRCQIKIFSAELRHSNSMPRLFGSNSRILPNAVLFEEGLLSDLANNIGRGFRNNLRLRRILKLP